MSIENSEAKTFALPASSEHLLTGLYTPGEKQALNPVDNASARELLDNNEKLIAAVHEQAAKIAAAAVATLAGMPAEHQDTFFHGISCFNASDDVIYNSIRKQWPGGDARTA